MSEVWLEASLGTLHNEGYQAEFNTGMESSFCRKSTDAQGQLSGPGSVRGVSCGSLTDVALLLGRRRRRTREPVANDLR